MEFPLQQFSQTTADLHAMVAASKTITVEDLKDKKQLEIVRANRITLMHTRTALEKEGKKYRENANCYLKDLLKKEKDLIAIIEPEEIRLAEIELQAKQNAIMEERLRKLPARHERLLAINNAPEIARGDYDAALLAMDDVQFDAYVNQVLFQRHENELAKQKADQDRIKAEQDARQAILDAQEAAIRADEAKARRAVEMEAAKEVARLEGVQKAKEDMARQAQREKEDKELQEIEARKKIAKLEKSKNYQAFLKLNGWTEETKGDFVINETELGFRLFKAIGFFSK